jgi:hypothetical protein
MRFALQDKISGRFWHARNATNLGALKSNSTRAIANIPSPFMTSPSLRAWYQYPVSVFFWPKPATDFYPGESGC